MHVPKNLFLLYILILIIEINTKCGIDLIHLVFKCHIISITHATFNNHIYRTLHAIEAWDMVIYIQTEIGEKKWLIINRLFFLSKLQLYYYLTKYESNCMCGIYDQRSTSLVY